MRADTWSIQSACVGIVLKETGSGSHQHACTFRSLEKVLQRLNDEAANRRWEELKASLQLSDEFIKSVKTYTERLLRDDEDVPFPEEYCRQIERLYETLASMLGVLPISK